jgi:hypothetical protein
MKKEYRRGSIARELSKKENQQRAGRPSHTYH